MLCRCGGVLGVWARAARRDRKERSSMPGKLALATVMAALAASLLILRCLWVAPHRPPEAARCGSSTHRATTRSTSTHRSATTCRVLGDPRRRCATVPVSREERRRGARHVCPEAATGQPVVSRDRKTYTFTVRAGHKASNGKTVTAQWFVHAFEHLQRPKMGDAASARFGGLHVLEALRVPRPSTTARHGGSAIVQARGNKFIIRLTQTFPSIVTALAMNWFGDRPRDALLRAGRERRRRCGAVLHREP